MLYYADESHVCTNGYVPYGWQFKNEDIYIPSEKAARLNIFGMITKRNQYKGFTTQESINADRIVDYLVFDRYCRLDFSRFLVGDLQGMLDSHV